MRAPQEEVQKDALNLTRSGGRCTAQGPLGRQLLLLQIRGPGSVSRMEAYGRKAEYRKHLVLHLDHAILLVISHPGGFT